MFEVLANDEVIIEVIIEIITLYFKKHLRSS